MNLLIVIAYALLQRWNNFPENITWNKTQVMDNNPDIKLHLLCILHTKSIFGYQTSEQADHFLWIFET